MSRSNLHTAIALLFVISGAVGLIYQVLWFKYLSLFLGNTTYAQTIVLATFMGGLAIGSAFWGRKADREPDLLMLYAWLELGIGLYCVAYPSLIDAVQNLFVRTVVGLALPSGGGAVLTLKLLASMGTLLFPTILMGGTLPVLVRFTSQHLDEAGRNVAVLYFLNSFGAVIGAGLAGFFFVRILGLGVTMYSAASVSLLIGLIALALMRLRQRWTDEQTPMAESGNEQGVFPERQVTAAIVVAGMSGMAAMIYEVTWVRLLIPVLGSSTYSFSLMLVGFISGITIGSLIVSSLVQRSARLIQLLAWCQFGIVGALVITIPLYARIPYTFWKMAHILVRTDATYPIFLVLQFIFCIGIMIVPTVFLGMSLPVATRIAARGLRVLGRSVGNVFSINTLGTVIGSLAAGLLLIPIIGMKHAMEVGIVLNLSAGILAFWSDTRAPTTRRVVVPVLASAGLTAYLALAPQWSQGAMLSGVFRQVNSNVPPPLSYERFMEAAEKTHVLYYREGTSATVGVIEGISDAGSQRVLIINGKADASSVGDLPTQVLLGELPLLLQQSPKSALVVGLGGGVTAGSILRHPVDRLDCVEISPEVVEASAYFEETSGAPLRDPRMHLHVEDALAFLKVTPQKYDVIVSEPSNPWIAGIGSLYTTEFFEACKRRMNPGGIMVQWFHLYEMDDELFRMVLRTFRSSFRSVTVWQPMTTDVILVGTEQPFKPDMEVLTARLQQPAVREDLRRVGLDDPKLILSLQMLSDHSVVYFRGTGPLNTEDHPRLEYEAPRAFFVNRGVTSILRVDERMNFDTGTIALRSQDAGLSLSDDDLRRIGLLHVRTDRGNPLFGYSVLRSYLSRHPGDTLTLSAMVDGAERLKRIEDALDYLETLTKLKLNDPNILARYAWMRYSYERTRANALTGFSTAEYERLLHRSIQLVRDTVDRYRVALGDVYFGTQHYALAQDQYARALQIRADHRPDPNIREDVLYLQLARCLQRTGRPDRAMGYALQAVNLNPENREASDFLYEMWTAARDTVQARTTP